MFEVCVTRSFTSKHFLIGGDWGAENELHAHDYKVEVILQGPRLNQHEYLVDIVDVKASLNGQLEIYAGRTLNDLPEFAGVNPSLELFAEILCRGIVATIDKTGIERVTVRLWEDAEAWASFAVQV